MLGCLLFAISLCLFLYSVGIDSVFQLLVQLQVFWFFQRRRKVIG